MEKKPTKYYSSKQENMIADYLGWSVTPASGARNFNPGDVKSSDWLAECKTHTSPKDRIHIKKEVWLKLANEAKSLFKSPVLIIDNGTQRAENTWCVFPKRLCGSDMPIVQGFSCIESDKSYSFSHARALSLFTDSNCFEIMIHNQSLLLVKAKFFKNMICGGDD